MQPGPFPFPYSVFLGSYFVHGPAHGHGPNLLSIWPAEGEQPQDTGVGDALKSAGDLGGDCLCFLNNGF